MVTRNRTGKILENYFEQLYGGDDLFLLGALHVHVDARLTEERESGMSRGSCFCLST